MFRTLFNSFLEICFLQRGPQDLPASGSFLRTLLITLAVAGFFINRLFIPTHKALLAVGLNLAVLIIITQLLLRLHKKTARITQTLSAMAGTGLVLALIGLPVFSMLALAEQQDQTASIGSILWLALFAWEVAVTAHILRHATEVTYGQGVLMALLYPLAYFQLAPYLIPA